jgi:hypothetical protein
MPSIPYQDSPVTSGSYDSGSQVGKINPTTRRNFRKMFAWVSESGGSDKVGSYKFPHHVTGSDGTPGAANVSAVQSALNSVDGSSIPDADKGAVKTHLERHLAKAGVKPSGAGKPADKPAEKKSLIHEDDDWRLDTGGWQV